ncbi:MAG: hypothetical protein Ct9H90mP2_02870 [Dehalococcoidia bacterium]|nr:MAG: hypothetical protein Ct9H90mP2_02870 [Dehalococcoidia bacterium]
MGFGIGAMGVLGLLLHELFGAKRYSQFLVL